MDDKQYITTSLLIHSMSDTRIIEPEQHYLDSSDVKCPYTGEQPLTHVCCCLFLEPSMWNTIN